MGIQEVQTKSLFSKRMGFFVLVTDELRLRPKNKKVGFYRKLILEQSKGEVEGDWSSRRVD